MLSAGPHKLMPGTAVQVCPPRQSQQLYPHAEEDGLGSSNADINPSDDSVFVPKKQLHIEVPKPAGDADDDKAGLSPR